ncbi:hypothetical protein [Thioalkalivibrio sp.]|nr:hypothetical protein [Thioalkalivibrio sp.]
MPNPRVLALRAFDGRQLAKYLTQLQREPGVRFRNTRTGEPLRIH